MVMDGIMDTLRLMEPSIVKISSKAAKKLYRQVIVQVILHHLVAFYAINGICTDIISLFLHTFSFYELGYVLMNKEENEIAMDYLNRLLPS